MSTNPLCTAKCSAVCPYLSQSDGEAPLPGSRRTISPWPCCAARKSGVPSRRSCGECGVPFSSCSLTSSLSPFYAASTKMKTPWIRKIDFLQVGQPPVSKTDLGMQASCVHDLHSHRSVTISSSIFQPCPQIKHSPGNMLSSTFLRSTALSDIWVITSRVAVRNPLSKTLNYVISDERKSKFGKTHERRQIAKSANQAVYIP